MVYSASYRRELMDIDLAWDGHPCHDVIVEAVQLFTRWRQPLQLFYHAIRKYAKALDRTTTTTRGQYVALYYHYGGTQSDLHTGVHNQASYRAAEAMFNEGYRVITEPRVYPNGMIFGRQINILQPENPHYLIPESAACA